MFFCINFVNRRFDFLFNALLFSYFCKENYLNEEIF